MSRYVCAAVFAILSANAMTQHARAEGPSMPAPRDTAGGILGTSQAGEPLPGLAAVQERLASMRAPFIENTGQMDPQVMFYAATFAGTLYVTERGTLVYSLPGPGQRDHPVATQMSGRPFQSPRSGWTLTETFVGGHGTPRAGTRNGANVSYLVGSADRHRSALATYNDVRLGEVFPGTEVSLRATGNNVEKIFTVAPGADPTRIRLRIEGASRLSTAPDGRLLIATGNGDIALTAPVAFQTIGNERRNFHAAYALDAGSGEYGFVVDDYDSRQPLVIDPLLQSTYLGGGSDDYVNALAVHPTSGEVLVAGITSSTDFPGTSAGAQPAHAADSGGSDGFVARLNPALTTLLQATYLGGGDNDVIAALTVHPSSGEVIVAGSTRSTNFPGTSGGAQPAHAADGGADDAFVARLDPTLTTLLQATYYGGNGYDSITALAVHPTSGEVLAAGGTTGSNLPGTSGGAQPASAGLNDGFVARFNPALTSLLQATYLGGTDYDSITALAVHPASGEVVVAGGTGSTDLQGTTGGAQAAHAAEPAGFGDGFIARLNPALTTLLQATYLGGGNREGINAMAIHPTSGEVIVAGDTLSTNFPGTAGGAQPAHGANSGNADGFVARLNATLTTLLQATYIGGSGIDGVSAITVHPSIGDVFVAGHTQSTNFPGTSNGAQPAHAADSGNDDGFVARLNPTLTSLVQATYLGGGLYDGVKAIVVHPASGEVLVAGDTQSSNFPGTAGGAQPHAADINDVFVTRLTPSLGTPTGLGCLDPDQNDAIDAHTDGLLIIRAMFGLTGSSVTNGAVGTGAGRTDWASIRTYLNANCGTAFASALVPPSEGSAESVSGPTPKSATAGCTFDVDGNNTIDALTDGLLILRAMSGLTGTAVTNNAVGSGATRTDWASIRAYLNGTCGGSFAP